MANNYVGVTGPATLDIIRELQVKNSSVGVLLLDQRIPNMSGGCVDFISRQFIARTSD